MILFSTLSPSFLRVMKVTKRYQEFSFIWVHQMKMEMLKLTFEWLSTTIFQQNPWLPSNCSNKSNDKYIRKLQQPGKWRANKETTSYTKVSKANYQMAPLKPETTIKPRTSSALLSSSRQKHGHLHHGVYSTDKSKVSELVSICTYQNWAERMQRVVRPSI
jgi:hypothetical protein